MGKSSRNYSTSKLGVDYEVQPEVQIDSESNMSYNSRKAGVKLISMLNARLEYTGQVTGKQYVWNTAGSVVEVDAEDSEILLAKRIGGETCCGNSKGGNVVFQIFKE